MAEQGLEEERARGQDGWVIGLRCGLLGAWETNLKRETGTML